LCKPLVTSLALLHERRNTIMKELFILTVLHNFFFILSM
jgi:hypothetical protein